MTDFTKYAVRTKHTLVDAKPKYCNVPNCAGTPMGYSLCFEHYRIVLRQLKGKQIPKLPNMEFPVVPKDPSRITCSVEGCVRKHAARGYCRTHARSFYRNQKKVSI